MISSTTDLAYYCDNARHLVCVPYSIASLHRMAADLGVKRCWYHSKSKYPHYDIPKRRIAEIQARCTVIEPRQILAIMKGQWPCPEKNSPLAIE
jgi:hypothetical protein